MNGAEINWGLRKTYMEKKKNGKCLRVTIPADLVKAKAIVPGSKIMFKTIHDGRIIIELNHGGETE